MLTEIGDLRLLSRRQRFGLLLVHWLAALQEVVYARIIKDRVWRSANGTVTPLRSMDRQHLWNAYNMCIRNGQLKAEITLALAREIDRRIQLRGSAC